jgi:hypothetical protein
MNSATFPLKSMRQNPRKIYNPLVATSLEKDQSYGPARFGVPISCNSCDFLFDISTVESCRPFF